MFFFAIIFAKFPKLKQKFVSIKQSYPSGRFSRRFAPQNDIKCVARNSIKSVRKLYYFFTNKLLFIPYEVLNVIAKHRLAVLWQSPGRAPYYKTHARYFCTCVEKKAHTSKRVSVIACDNVISKVQSAPRTQGFSEPAKNHHGVPTRYCVLVGLKTSNSRLLRRVIKAPVGVLLFWENHI